MKTAFLLTAAASLALGTAASGQVLYSDTFQRVTGSGDGNGDPNGPADNFSDWGMNDNALGGSVVQTWVAGPDRAGGGRNAVTDGNLGISHGTSSTFEFDAAAASPLGFTIEFDFSRFVVTPDPGPGAGGYIAFGLGVDGGTAPSDFTALGASDFALLFQQANNGNAANAEAWVDGASISNFDYLTPDVPHRLKLEVTPQVAGAYGDADLVDIVATVDGSIVQNYTVNGGADFGHFTVSANNFDTRYIDNLVVTTVPEPATLALAGLGAIAMLRRRA